MTIYTPATKDSQLIGNIALVSNPLVPKNSKQKKSSYWFKEWKVSGTKLVVNKDHTFGPSFVFDVYIESWCVESERANATNG